MRLMAKLLTCSTESAMAFSISKTSLPGVITPKIFAAVPSTARDMVGIIEIAVVQAALQP